jgi:hypothetical protein
VIVLVILSIIVIWTLLGFFKRVFGRLGGRPSMPVNEANAGT